MISDIVNLHNSNCEAISKWEKEFEKANAEILTMVAQKRTNETSYLNQQRKRAEATASIAVYKAINVQIMTIVGKFDDVILEKFGLVR